MTGSESSLQSAPLDQFTSETADQARNARWLFSIGLALVIVACAYYGFTAKVDDPLHLYLALTILVLAAVPGLLWAKAGGKQLPMFPVMMLTSANCYALPILDGHNALVRFSDEITTSAAITVLIYQACAIGAFHLMRFAPGRAPFFTREVLTQGVYRYVGYGLTLTTIYTYLATFEDVIPHDLNSAFRAVFYGIGIVSVFVQSRRWGLGTLAHQEKFPFVANIVIQVLIQFATLFLVGGLSVILLALIGYVSGARKIPILATTITLFVVALLHNGKAAMRAEYWADGYQQRVSPSELPEFYGKWLENSFDTEDREDEQRMTTKLLQRTSLFHLLCLIQSITPEKKSYLNGETYTYIPGQFVPRFFWPDKPLAHVGTSLLAVYYGLQREEDTLKTTIGFGMLNEAYANFGNFGAVFIGVFLGGLYKLVQAKTRNSPLISYAGLMSVALTAWSFQTEFTLSMWLSSMFQACVAIMGLPFLIRNFLG